MNNTLPRADSLELSHDLKAVSMIGGKGDKEPYRDFVVSLAEMTPILRRITDRVEASWVELTEDTKARILAIKENLESIARRGSHFPRPKSWADRIWLGFSDEIRVSIWEFAEATGRFIGAVRQAIKSDLAREASIMAEVVRTDPEFVDMHLRSVVALDQGAKPIFVDWATIRPTNM